MRHTILAQPPAAHPSGNPGDAWMQAMRRGDFAAAWAISDRILAGRDPAQRDDPAQPYHLRWVWDGRSFHGRDVLVRCYHGLGDTLQFCRYLAPLRARVRSLTLEVQPELLPLMANVAGPDRLIPFDCAAPAPPSECDFEIMELAHALRLRPDPTPYLGTAIPTLRRAGPGPRVGLCWRAGAWQAERSLPLALLAPVATIPGATWFSLQRGPGAAELQAPGAPAVANPEDTSTDVLDTARLIRSLDLVVTVDTMVAHLAGALGARVWLLLPAEPDWRWSAGGTGSVWYANVRKYQQTHAGDWAAPLAALAADLTRFIIGYSLSGTLGSPRGL